jgi:hypothetical protein
MSANRESSWRQWLLSVGTLVSLFVSLFTGPALADKRVALVIGNSVYLHAGILPNPARDAEAMGILFASMGFDVVQTRYDLGVNELRRSIRDFTDAARDADIAIVFFAGHGLEVDGINYLVPADARLEKDIDVDDETVSLDRVLKALEPAKQLRLVILDACRDNPFLTTMQRTIGTRAIGRGLARVEPRTADTLIAFAARAGSMAADGTGTHSPFTEALMHNMDTPGLDIRIAFGRVRDEVLKSTGNQQEPVIYGSLGGTNVALVSAQDGLAGTNLNPAPATTEMLREYEMAAKVGTKEAWEAFLGAYSSGFYADLARAQLAKLLASAPAKPEPPAVASSDAPTAPVHPVARSLRPEAAEEDAKPSEMPRARSNRVKQVPKHATGRARGPYGCGTLRRAVSAATAAGLDNGVGIISQARTYCGG